jgi:hypothetical protein
MLGVALANLLQSVPLLCIKAFRDTDLEKLSVNVSMACACSLLVGVIALIPGFRQTINTCWLSIGER